ncbi:MAG: 3'(2'),5'-bisphosphate nucleotidase CysQ [Polyangia bacterium]
MPDHLKEEQEIAGLAAREAGEIILRHYARGSIAVETKADFSPVTAADRDANAAILARLMAAFPGDALLSEETPDDLTRLAARRVWIVDPLDGTRDFVARTGEFCVHVALAIDGRPVVGAVFHPVAAMLYTAAAGGGAFAEDARGARTVLRVSELASPSTVRVGVSRTNAAGSLKQLLAETGLAPRAVSMGASVKLMALAGGRLDAVLNLSGNEQEWDTCAPEVVIREAGGLITDTLGHDFRYNQRDVSHHRGSIASNGACHQVMRDLVHPYALAAGPPGGA